MEGLSNEFKDGDIVQARDRRTENWITGKYYGKKDANGRFFLKPYGWIKPAYFHYMRLLSLESGDEVEIRNEDDWKKGKFVLKDSKGWKVKVNGESEPKYYEDVRPPKKKKAKKPEKKDIYIANLSSDEDVEDMESSPKPKRVVLDLTTEETSSMKYTVGEDVKAKYRDGRFYDAVIVKIVGNGRYKIAWDDEAQHDLLKTEEEIRTLKTRKRKRRMRRLELSSDEESEESSTPPPKKKRRKAGKPSSKKPPLPKPTLSRKRKRAADGRKQRKRLAANKAKPRKKCATRFPNPQGNGRYREKSFNEAPRTVVVPEDGILEITSWVANGDCRPVFYIKFKPEARFKTDSQWVAFHYVDHMTEAFEYALEHNLDRYAYFEPKAINGQSGDSCRVVTYDGFAFWVKKSLVKHTKAYKDWKKLSKSERKALEEAIKFKSIPGENQTIASEFAEDEAKLCKKLGLFVLEVSADDCALVYCKNSECYWFSKGVVPANLIDEYSSIQLLVAQLIYQVDREKGVYDSLRAVFAYCEFASKKDIYADTSYQDKAFVLEEVTGFMQDYKMDPERNMPRDEYWKFLDATQLLSLNSTQKRRKAHLLLSALRYDWKPRRTVIDKDWFKGEGPQAKKKRKEWSKDPLNSHTWTLPERLTLVQIFIDEKTFSPSTEEWEKHRKANWNGKKFKERTVGALKSKASRFQILESKPSRSRAKIGEREEKNLDWSPPDTIFDCGDSSMREQLDIPALTKKQKTQIKDAKIVVITGEGACGKSFILREHFGDPSEMTKWDDQSIMTHWETTEANVNKDYERLSNHLCAAGLGSIPVWFRPYSTLSAGEKRRADIAALLQTHEGKRIIIDDFLTRLDFETKISISITLSRMVRKMKGTSLVVVAIPEVIPFLQPDLVIEVSHWSKTLRMTPRKPKPIKTHAIADSNTWPLSSAKNTKEVKLSSRSWKGVKEAKKPQQIDKSKPVHKLQTNIKGTTPLMELVDNLLDTNFSSHPNVPAMITIIPDEMLPDESSFTVGLIIGKSGSGKSSIACNTYNLWGAHELEKLMKSKKAISQHLSPELLQLVQLEPSTWERRVSSLSSSELERFSIGLAIKSGKNEVKLLDEFTNSMGRKEAYELCTSLLKGRKMIKKMKSKLVLVTSSSDVVPWIQPDWCFDADTRTMHAFTPQQKVGVAPASFDWKSAPHPQIDITISQTHYKTWYNMGFGRYHYKTDAINGGARCWLSNVNIPGYTSAVANFFSIFISMGSHFEHRTVTLPTWQGLGIASTTCAAVCEFYNELGVKIISKTSHPHYGNRDRSPLWEATDENGKKGTTGMWNRSGKGSQQSKDKVKTSFVFRYAGRKTKKAKEYFKKKITYKSLSKKNKEALQDRMNSKQT